ncbi:hypothetical protein ABIE58_003435 [Roseovarius sp. MBR-78]
MPSGPRHNPDIMHLQVVCNDTCALGLNLLVPISSFFDGCDDTCLLDTGDHKSVLHLSYVFYANAKIFRASQIDKGLEIKFLFPKPDLAEAVFQRIEQGICVSPDTPPNVRKYHGC